MENRAYAIAVGLFTLLLGFALVFSYWWLAGAKQSIAEYVVVSRLPVTGLSAESSVKFRGVKVGKVTKIALDPQTKTNIFANIQILESLQLSKEAYAELRMQGITGLAYIDLNDVSTTAPRLEAGGHIPLQPSLIDKLVERGPILISQIETLLKTSGEAADTANKFLNKIDIEKLNKTLANLERATDKLGPMLGSVTTAANRVSGMASEKNQLQLTQTLLSVQKTADDARPLLAELDETAKEFKGMARDVKQNANQLSDTLHSETLPQLHQLTQSLNRDVSHFGRFIDMLEDNPQSLIFGGPEAMPGPGEAGFNPKPTRE
jgi:phospholipid/cholesterol/gamma-HCH transport system substrate-binding protein